MAELLGVERVVHSRDSAATTDLLKTRDVLLGRAVADRKQDRAVGEFAYLLQMLNAGREADPIVAKHLLCNVIRRHKSRVEHWYDAVLLTLGEQFLKRWDRCAPLGVGRF